MGQVFRTRQAEEDLLEIWLYIAEQSVDAADSLLGLIEEKCSVLAATPLLGAICPEIAPELRYLVVGNYVIYYRVDQNRPTVVRVLHGARDIVTLFGPH